MRVTPEVWAAFVDRAHRIATAADVVVGDQPITRNEVARALAEAHARLRADMSIDTFRIYCFELTRLPDNGARIEFRHYLWDVHSN